MYVNIELDAIVNVLRTGVRRAAAFMGLGISAAIDPDFRRVSLPNSESNLHLLPEPISDEVISEIKREFKIWVEAGGFREICEALEVYLTEIYRCAMLANVSADGKIPSGTTLEIPTNFSRKGFRVKLAMLKADFGLSPMYPESLSSLWDARNCLTHRRGYVGVEDVDESDALTVKWIGLDTFFVDPSGTEILLEVNFAPFSAEHGGKVITRVAERVRKFPRRHRIDLSAHDIAEICWFTLTQSDVIVQSLIQFFKGKGIPIRESPA